MTDKLRENLGKALECELRELLRTKEAPYMDLAEACQSAARAALAAAPQPAPDPLRETDVPHMHPMEVMARNFRAKLRAALATPQPAPDAVALGQALYDAVHYAAERGDVDSMGIVLRPLWEWHVAFVEPGTAIPEEIKAVPTPQPASADREALVEVIEDALYSHSDERGWELTGTAQSIADALLARGLRLPGGETMTSAARDVLAERQRQINVEGWTPEDDDRYENGDLANAAACYAVHAAEEGAPTDAAPSAWPWDAKWWKPSTPRRDLVKAGALILAEIERLDRAEGDTP